MSLLQAALLGLVQGLTEFIPVSSTAHMVLLMRVLDLDRRLTPEQMTATMAVVQLGTLAAVLAYFARDFAAIASSLVTRPGPAATDGERSAHRRRRLMAWYLVLGTAPVAAVGLAFKDTIEGSLTKNLHVIAASMIGVAFLLLLAERLGSRRRGEGDLRWTDALAVGAAQVLALVPGASRSGTTLAGALFMGLTREAGARFSFLLSAPAVAASGLLEAVSVREGLASVGWLELAAATLVAAVSGFLSIEFLLRFLRRRSTAIFVAYRVALGALLLGLLQSGVVGSGGVR